MILTTNISSAARTSLVMPEQLIATVRLFGLFGASSTAPYMPCAIQRGSSAKGTVAIKRFTHLNIRQLYWSTGSLLTYLDPKLAATMITTSLRHPAFWRNVPNMPSIQIPMPPCLHCSAASSCLGTLRMASALS